MKRSISLALIALLLLAGCSTGKKEPAPTEPRSVPPVEQPDKKSSEPEPVGDPPSLTLMPQPETAYAYSLSDGTNANEWYLRDGERLIGAYNGKPYVTWFVLPQGIYRIDPKGKALLRYLPRELKDGLAWKQESGDAEVWFALKSATCEMPTGQSSDQCWALTVLNRGERTVFRLFPRVGIAHVAAENLAKPADSFTKRQMYGGKPLPVAKEQMLAAAVALPEGPVPEVTEATPAQFDQALRAMLTQYGLSVTEIDLDGDGTDERIEGAIGQWSDLPMHLHNSKGQEIAYAFHGQLPPGMKNRLEIVSIPGVKVPTLVYEVARTPEAWHGIQFLWYNGQGLSGAYGWAPKLTTASGAGWRVEADGRVAILSSGDGMGGYSETKWFKLEPSTDQYSAFNVKPVGRELKAGPYPTEPADLLAAVMVAHWSKQDADFARFVPDPVVRAKIEAAEVGAPMYHPIQPELGTLSYKPNQTGNQDPEPVFTPGPVGAVGSTGFMISRQEYEGGSYWTGKITFGKADDGRLIVTDFALEKTGWNY